MAAFTCLQSCKGKKLYLRWPLSITSRISAFAFRGAVALDGRIEAGDMILQVNDISFEHMSNDDAVKVLRDAVRTPGPIKLVVAKCWEQEPKGYFTLPRPGNRAEPVCPIDPGAWVAHTNALLGQDQMQGPAGMRVMPGMIGVPGGLVGAQGMGPPPDYMRPPSVSTVTSNNSGSFTSSVPESDSKCGLLCLVHSLYDFRFDTFRVLRRLEAGRQSS